MKFKHPVKAEKNRPRLGGKTCVGPGKRLRKTRVRAGKKAFRWSPGSAPHMVNFQNPATGNGSPPGHYRMGVHPDARRSELTGHYAGENYKPLEVATLLTCPNPRAGDALTASAQGVTIHAQTVHINQATDRETVKAAAPLRRTPMSDKLTPKWRPP